MSSGNGSADALERAAAAAAPLVAIADDDPVVRTLLRLWLEGAGYQVLEAPDGNALLDLLRQVVVQLVLLDVSMPGPSGFDVLEAMRDDPLARDVAVVFVTGAVATGDIVRGLRLGAQDYITKPFDGPELVERVAAALRRKRADDELRRRVMELEHRAGGPPGEPTQQPGARAFDTSPVPRALLSLREGQAQVVRHNPAFAALGDPVGAALPLRAGAAITLGRVVDADVEWHAADGQHVHAHLVVIEDRGDEIIALAEVEARTPRPSAAPVAGLLSEADLRQAVSEALARVRRRGGGVAVCAVGLDVSEQPATRDALATAAEAVRATAPAAVGATARDELVVLFEDVADHDALPQLGERLAARVAGARAPAVGIAWTSDAALGQARLITDARAAMLRSRRRRDRRCEIWTDALRVEAVDQRRAELELAAAVEHDQLVVRYQPVVEVGTRTLVGVEALVRWQHPTAGLLGPERFLTVAEETGDISAVGAWVLERACADAASWIERRNGNFDLAVNLSPAQLRDPDLAATVRAALTSNGVPPQRLCLELTEQLYADPDGTARVPLANLREIGVRLAIDDFGAGYAALGYLRTVPAQVLKIDRMFVDEVATRPGDRAIVAAVLEMAHNLGLDVIAEGVEDEATLQVLAELGCPFAQGLYLGGPSPAEAVDALLANA